MFTIKIHFYFQEIASNSALKKHTFRLLQMAIQESKSKSISNSSDLNLSFLFFLRIRTFFPLLLNFLMRCHVSEWIVSEYCAQHRRSRKSVDDTFVSASDAISRKFPKGESIAPPGASPSPSLRLSLTRFWPLGSQICLYLLCWSSNK